MCLPKRGGGGGGGGIMSPWCTIAPTLVTTLYMLIVVRDSNCISEWREGCVERGIIPGCRVGVCQEQTSSSRQGGGYCRQRSPLAAETAPHPSHWGLTAVEC